MVEITSELQRTLDLQASYTAQEHLCMGSTPDFPKDRPFFLFDGKLTKIPMDRQPYIPQGVIYRQLPLKRAIEVRKEEGFFISRGMGSRLGLGDKAVAIKFEELDPKTGETLQNPTILGVYDDETKQVTQVEGRDLNKEFYDEVKKIRETATFGELMDLILNPRPKDVGKEFEEFIIEEDEGESTRV